MKYQAVIFDLFGTLVKTWPSRKCQQVMREMAQVFSAPPDEFQHLWFEQLDWLTMRELRVQEEYSAVVCHKLGIPITKSQVKRASGIWFEFALETLTPRHEAIQTLNTLRENQYKIGLISDCADEVPVLWERAPLAPMIDAAAFSCVFGVRKPDPRIYQTAADRLGVRLQNCVYVGDGGSQELSGALSMGMHPVFINVPSEEKADISFTVEEWHGPVISSLKEILDLIE